MGGGRRVGGRGIGFGTIVIALIDGWIFGINPLTVLGLLGGGGGGGGPAVTQQAPPGAPAQRPPAQDKQAAFVSTILADTEDVWGRIFKASGNAYQAPKLVLFSGRTASACGAGEAAMGPVLLPGRPQGVPGPGLLRHPVAAQLGAPGDFAAGLRDRA